MRPSAYNRYNYEELDRYVIERNCDELFLAELSKMFEIDYHSVWRRLRMKNIKHSKKVRLRIKYNVRVFEVKDMKKIRIKLNVSQSEIAESLGITKQLVSKWETGRNSIPIKYLEKVKTLLDLTDIQIRIIN